MKRISERLKRYDIGLSPALENMPAGTTIIPPERAARVIVIGHKNPDTDSIAAAAGYAQLKQFMGLANAEPACAGLPSARTEFLFGKFNVPLPAVLADVHPRVRNVMDSKSPCVYEGHTLLEAMSILQRTHRHRVPVVDLKRKYLGMVSLFDLADRLVLQAAEGGFDGAGGGLIGREIQTSIAHIQEVLKAKALSLYRADTIEELEVYVGAMSEETLRERMGKRERTRVALVVGDRYKIHKMAVEMRLRLMIVTGNFPVDEDLIDEARSNGTCVLQTPYDSATTVRRLKFSAPAEFVLQENVTTFQQDEKLSDVHDLIHGEREETFPVLDEDERLVGTLSKDYVDHELPLKLILVDHNELSQAVDGAAEVPIVEILDHHRLGSQQTQSPITFINEVVGSSCTLVCEQFRRFNHAPTPAMAGVLMGGIITDTLMLRSPTSTPRDKAALDFLKELCQTDPKTLAAEILSVGSSIAALPARKVITADKKDYATEKYKFAVAQVEEVGFENFFQHRTELLQEIQALIKAEQFDFFALLVTNVVRETSMMLCAGEKRILDRINYTRLDDHTFDLPGVLSRKKQLLPLLLKVMS
ncbi:MAG TPA: putative manganese-dependent inorganic diphosphatase [Planctomycetota bacterium]|nr:putative manganese-dependent inorganic diphosphatase [Planctomycetota bacterium]